jgi:hypothetical protein
MEYVTRDLCPYGAAPIEKAVREADHLLKFLGSALGQLNIALIRGATRLLAQHNDSYRRADEHF